MIYIYLQKIRNLHNFIMLYNILLNEYNNLLNIVNFEHIYLMNLLSMDNHIFDICMIINQRQHKDSLLLVNHENIPWIQDHSLRNLLSRGISKYQLCSLFLLKV